MNTNYLSGRALRRPLLAIGLLIAGSPIFAQEAEQQSDSPSPQLANDVTVVAPYTVHKKTVRRGGHVAEEVISLSIKVSYSDLDLTRHKDTIELDKRVSDAAKEACKQLYTLYPDHHAGKRAERSCAKTAYATATPHTASIIEAVNR